MPRIARGPRNSVNDRPGRLKLLLRRQRRLLRPAGWAVHESREEEVAAVFAGEAADEAPAEPPVLASTGRGT